MMECDWSRSDHVTREIRVACEYASEDSDAFLYLYCVLYKENISGLAITTSLGSQENIKKMECLKNGFHAYHIFNPLGNSVKNHAAEKQNIVSIL